MFNRQWSRSAIQEPIVRQGLRSFNHGVRRSSPEGNTARQSFDGNNQAGPVEVIQLVLFVLPNLVSIGLQSTSRDSTRFIALYKSQVTTVHAMLQALTACWFASQEQRSSIVSRPRLT